MNTDDQMALSEGRSIPPIGRPDQLGVASPFDGNVGSCKELLARAGLSNSAVDMRSIEGEDTKAIDEWLNSNPNGHCLVFWQSPVVLLARAMAEGLAPDKVLTDWLARAESVMAAVRTNRRRITMIEGTLAKAHPNLLAERLNQRLALPLATPGSITGSQEEHDPVELLIAEHALSSNPQSHRLIRELEATSMPLLRGESPLMPDPLTAWNSYRGRSKAGSVDVEELKEENDLLLLQLHQVQEELESNYLGSLDLDKKYGQSEAVRKKLDKQLRATEQRARQLQATIDKMRKSRSWRISKPLRTWSKLFGGGKSTA